MGGRAPPGSHSNPGPSEGLTSEKDRGRARPVSRDSPTHESNAAHSGVFLAIEQAAGQAGKQNPGAGLESAWQELGQREAPSEQPHTWLANAGSGGDVPWAKGRFQAPGYQDVI